MQVVLAAATRNKPKETKCKRGSLLQLLLALLLLLVHAVALLLGHALLLLHVILVLLLLLLLLYRAYLCVSLRLEGGNDEALLAANCCP